MTATAIAKPRAYYSAALPTTTFRGYKIDHQADGTAIIRDLKMFKKGTFRDSWGEQTSWDATHLQQMVDNFAALSVSQIFAEPPARSDHSRTIDKVFGYLLSIRTDGEFIFTDVHVTKSGTIENFINGTYRNVSAEIGMYTTNDEMSYWPVVFGVACVDVPAVEGLYNKKNGQVSYFSQTPEQEAPMGAENSTTTTAAPPANQGGVTINLNGSQLTPDKPVAQYAVGDSTMQQNPAPVVTLASVATTVIPQSPFEFTMGGVKTTDFAKVQAHITALEAFEKTMIQKGRTDFVSELLANGKITKAQEADVTALATSMNDDTFAAYAKTYASAPKVRTLQQFGSELADENADPGEIDEIDDEISIQEETIAGFRRASQSEAFITKTKAFTRLQELKLLKSKS